MKRFLLLALALLLCAALCACGMSPAGVWKKDFYLDSFNQPTEDPYIGTGSRIKGTYNSATVSDGALEAELRVDPETVSIYLYENGSDKVKNGNNERVYFPVTVKRADGSTFEIDGVMTGGSDHIEISENQLMSLLGEESEGAGYISDALCAKDGEVSFYITRSDQAATNYLFTVKCGNFAALYTDEILAPYLEKLSEFGLQMLQDKDYDTLFDILPLMDRFRGRSERIDAAIETFSSSVYQKAKTLSDDGRTFEALELFVRLGEYQDSENWARWMTARLGGANDVGLSYERGDGVEQDYARAMEWYLRAAEAGDKYATRNVGLLYKNGYGVKQDYDKAMEWYLKAADLGSAAAMNNIGIMYKKGEGVKQDYGKAMEWYLKAADLGSAAAMNNIGVMYGKGEGVKQDYGKAMEWYLKAAKAGSEYAMENIGFYYKNGYGVEQDYGKAMEWFQKAAEAGKESAQEEYDKLYEKGYRVP